MDREGEIREEKERKGEGRKRERGEDGFKEGRGYICPPTFDMLTPLYGCTTVRYNHSPFTSPGWLSRPI